MPWQECTVTDQREDFVALATQEGVNMCELCRRFGISPKTGYKLLHRYAQGGVAGLADRSRRPHTSPRQTPPEMVARICALRREHPWGGRKIHHRLIRDGVANVPAPSTITAILKREGLLVIDTRPVTGTFCRFERAAPNELWQMDFMGHKPLQHGGRVHPLTVVDDHSRYLLTLVAAGNEQQATVQPALITCFRQYGLPWAMLADNGPPWGTMDKAGWTQLEVWLLRLGITLVHGRPLHPQTQGKVERLHGTLATDVFGTQVFADLGCTQTAFDAFRVVYNHDRPHESLAYAVPADRYRMSARPYPETLPEITYADDAQVRVVGGNGTISFAGRRIQIGEAFRGLPVGVVATATDGVYRVQFGQQALGQLDLRQLRKGPSRCYLCP